MKYIGLFDVPKLESQHRNVAASARTKMGYICKKVSSIVECPIQVVSPTWTGNEKGHYPQQSSIENDFILTVAPTFGAKTKIKKALRILNAQLWLFAFLMRNTQKDEKIIFYHALPFIPVICVAKRLKHFYLIAEVEEIYQNVHHYSSFTEKQEYALFADADAYIFSTQNLNQALNQAKKPYVVINGIYEVAPIHHAMFDDDKIHCVYAGIFDPTKGGAAAAVAAAEFLPENYHMHIIGFGTKQQKETLLKQIEEVQKKTKCTLTYDGLLLGEAYIEFLQKCQIGLCTQIPDAKYTETSFPSKILSYMSNGLRVLSVRIPSIEQSDVGEDIYYYDEQDSHVIAEGILKIDFSQPYDGRNRLRRLDEKFQKEMRVLLQEV